MSVPAQAPTTATAETRDARAGAARILSFDVFRGLVMFLMLAEVMHLPELVRAFPGNVIVSTIAFHTSHVAWAWGSLHDMIQPGFSFLVGAALPFSIASRKRKGQTLGRMLLHAAWRAMLLICLGIFLRSIGRPQTNFTFEDTLTQIGLGYFFLFLLGLTTVRVQAIATILILIGYWAVFALFPAPPPNFDYQAVGVPADWPHHYSGFASHWNKNSNAAWAFDTWFLNLFPRERPFLSNGGGYSTLNFIPTLATMLLGLLAGEWLRTDRAIIDKLRYLIVAGLALIGMAILLHVTGVCPIVKRIWTPAFTLYSGGWVLLILSAIYAAVEWQGWQGWAFPLTVIGMNSIFIYLASWTTERFIIDALNRHLGENTFTHAGPFADLVRGLAVLAIFWAVLLWMHRRKIYIRI